MLIHGYHTSSRDRVYVSHFCGLSVVFMQCSGITAGEPWRNTPLRPKEVLSDEDHRKFLAANDLDANSSDKITENNVRLVAVS